ncbi:hypothetical protein JJC03_13265 [Flavobacterium oreochromis]|nr:hypothetical protein [Flavobacterium oreochromis]QYS85993.1 hypothetical protein JJC03_13265 [Flavobacterium oreochromis]
MKSMIDLNSKTPVFSISSESAFRTGMITDLTLGALKTKIPVGNLEPGSAQTVGQAVIDTTVEINSQVLSNKINDNNCSSEEKCD